jgi:hypothetical protein
MNMPTLTGKHPSCNRCLLCHPRQGSALDFVEKVYLDEETHRLHQRDWTRDEMRDARDIRHDGISSSPEDRAHASWGMMAHAQVQGLA